MSQHPVFTKLLGCEWSADHKDATLRLEAEDGTPYKLTIKGAAIGEAIDALQDARARDKRLLMLTVVGHQALAHPKSTALLLQTQELGSIACVIPTERLAGLRADLAKMETTAPSDRKH